MSQTERRTWAVAVALWLLWALHVYFDAWLFKCIATGALAVICSIAGAAQAIDRASRT